MSGLSLGASATTGLFTLLGAISGGALTIYLEIARRRWHKQDTEKEEKKRHRSERDTEKKALYLQLLAKGVELDYAIASAYSSEPLERLDSESDERFEKQWDQILSRTAQVMQEWEALRARCELIANDTIRALISMWDAYLVDIMSNAARGKRSTGQEWSNSPYHALVKAMRDELQLFEMGSIGNQLPRARNTTS